jgi:hypothetical protein
MVVKQIGVKVCYESCYCYETKPQPRGVGYRILYAAVRYRF